MISLFFKENSKNLYLHNPNREFLFDIIDCKFIMGVDDQVLSKKEYIVRTLAIHRPANPQVCWMDNSLSKQARATKYCII